jgi:hypothetical protein
MAISCTLDVFPNSTLELAASDVGTPNRFVRIGIVEGIDVSVVTGSPKYEAMFLASAAVQAACVANPLTNHPEYVIRRILLEPLSDTTALARIIYETIVFGVGIPPSTYVLTDGTMASTVETNFMIDKNGKKRKISAAWDDPYEVSGAPSISEDIITMSLFEPWRTLQVDALVYGRPTDGQSKIRFVNDAQWPTQFPTFPGVPNSDPVPLPRGYWMLAEWVTRLFKTSGYYTLSAKAVSRVNRDWSEGGMLTDIHTGKYVQVGATIAEGDAIIDALFSTPYENDILYGDDPMSAFGRAVGAIRVGAYHVADFGQIFGF